MMTRAQRLEHFSFYAREKDCVICSAWPRAERAQRRIDGDYIRFPIKGACARCWLAFVKEICIVTDSPEELDALRQAVRRERKAGRLTPAQELLEQIRSEKPTKH